MHAVQERVAVAGVENVWLAGHSLGAAIAMAVGKKMVVNDEKGYLLKTYLFNPPFVGIPIEMLINDEKLKQGIRFAGTCVKEILTNAVAGDLHHQQRHDDSFAAVSRWHPYLFVNKNDPICTEYIDYFRNREDMKQNGAESERSAGKISSIMSLLSSALVGGDLEAAHLLPSAHVTTNTGKAPDVGQAHGIDQWWDRYLTSESKLYQYRPH
jgi:hypothetical protein